MRVRVIVVSFFKVFSCEGFSEIFYKQNFIYYINLIISIYLGYILSIE